MHRLVHSRVHSALSGGQRQVGLHPPSAKHHRCDCNYPLLCHHGDGRCRDAWGRARGRRSDTARAEDDESVLAHEAGQTLPGPADTGADAQALLPGDGHADGVCLRRHGNLQRSGTATGARPGHGLAEQRLRQHPGRRLVGHHLHDYGWIRGRVSRDDRGPGARRDVCSEWDCPPGTAHHVHLPQFCSVLPRTQASLCQICTQPL